MDMQLLPTISALALCRLFAEVITERISAKFHESGANPDLMFYQVCGSRADPDSNFCLLSHKKYEHHTLISKI